MANQNNNFEAMLFNTADKLRKNIDAAEYKNVVLGLIFLKYISDSFLELFEQLEQDDYSDSEDTDEYFLGEFAIRGINSKFVSWNTEGSFLKDTHPDLKADFILANPPFNQSEWGQDILQEDGRWKYGLPPAGNANFAWMQHMLYHLAPHGVMATVLANGSLSSNTSGEGALGYEDLKGYCKSAKREEIEKHNFILTPGRYVGIPDEEDDGIPFEDKMNDLTATLAEQMQKEKELDVQIKEQLEQIGFVL